MAKTEKSVWLKQGYNLFAEKGMNGLKVEELARRVGKSKSSFYHHFSDVESFISLLLKMHTQQAFALAENLPYLNTENGELFQLLPVYREDILFHRQLRIHRQVPEYQHCIGEIMTILETPFVEVLSRMLHLPDSKSTLRLLFVFCVDHFLLRLSNLDIQAECLQQYYQEVAYLVKKLRSLPENAS
jgi:AcrR family transcriptional regulator